MDPRAFWRYIDDARALAEGDMEDAADLLEARLSLLPAEEILGFARRFAGADRRAYRYDLWAAAHILNGGADEDCFRFFRWYVIGLGEAVFAAALADPDSLAFLADRGAYQFAYDAEGFGYAAVEAHESVTGRPLPPAGPPPPETPAGEPWDAEEAHRVVPAIAAAVGWIES